MRSKTLSPLLAIALIALLAAPASAPAVVGGAGHNKPTTALEDAFKLALYWRSVSQDGCYPPPHEFAARLRKARPRLRVRVVRDVRSIRRRGVVYVLRRGSSCDRIRLGLRTKKGVYILDSASGTVRFHGKHGPRTHPGQSGTARQVRLVSRSFRLQGPDDTQRLETLCPRRSFPLGGGMIASPGPGADGEGAYPHSYERLGAQRGWHINVILYDPNRSSTAPRDITIQTVCGRFLRPSNPTPHATVFIRSGETKSATARCPKGQFLIAGGFNRTNFDSTGGNYVTESRADGPRAWRVTGSAFGGSGGGELVAIAYCVKRRGPILTEVSASAPVPFGATATATTPSCPAGLRMTSTGFSAAPSALYAGSSLNPDGTTTATAVGHFAAAPTLTAYGYCMRARR
ncbi:MAG TPA: hypothetical protein VF052_11165 [Solirubrobacterales bacterium]